MSIKRIREELNVVAQCERYGLSLRECPQFLFLAMGFLIIATLLISYFIAIHYIGDPEIVALLILLIGAALFVLSHIITRSFERLAEANRMKSEFVTIVSHQLRSPLTSLRWAMDFIMSGQLGKIEEKPLEYLKIIKENSDRMVELLRDLLIVSRLEQKEVTLLKKEVSLGDLTKEIVEGYLPFARASNIEIRLEGISDLPKVFADPSQLKIAIEALLDNAIRYTKGQGEIKIRFKSANEKVQFEIEDQGIGIPKEDRKYIFQKFFRSANALRHQTQGSGLGLFIVKAIVEKSGGEIGFKSEEGKGTTFWFTVPIK